MFNLYNNLIKSLTTSDVGDESISFYSDNWISRLQYYDIVKRLCDR